MSIKSARESKRLTQKALAQLIGVSRTTVSMWESGEVYPRADKLPELARILGCSIDELFGAAGAGREFRRLPAGAVANIYRHGLDRKRAFGAVCGERGGKRLYRAQGRPCGF